MLLLTTPDRPSLFPYMVVLETAPANTVLQHHYTGAHYVQCSALSPLHIKSTTHLSGFIVLSSADNQS